MGQTSSWSPAEKRSVFNSALRSKRQAQASGFSSRLAAWKPPHRTRSLEVIREREVVTDAFLCGLANDLYCGLLASELSQSWQRNVQPNRSVHPRPTLYSTYLKSAFSFSVLSSIPAAAAFFSSGGPLLSLFLLLKYMYAQSPQCATSLAR